MVEFLGQWQSPKNVLGLMAFWDYQIPLERSEVEKGQPPNVFC